jgi:hypothetical protein
MLECREPQVIHKALGAPVPIEQAAARRITPRAVRVLHQKSTIKNWQLQLAIASRQ